MHQENPTSPIRADTDGDGVNDNLDPDPGQLPTPTPLPTDTPLPTATLSPTATPLPTGTPIPTGTVTPTLLPTATSTSAPTATHTPTPTPEPTLDPNLLAYYPLEDSAEDLTGNYSNITLQNAPFQADGGVFCNGIYSGDNKCQVITPQLNSFDYNSFSISAQFKVTEFNTMPVFVGGNSWRWIGYYLNGDGTVSMLYNNSQRETCGGEYTLDDWHTAVVTYDGTEAKLYLDNFLRCTVTFNLEHGNDRNVGVTNFSNAEIYKGVIRELKVYKTVIQPFPVLILPPILVTVAPIGPVISP